MAMDRFEEMRVFVRIMERRSFSRAADDLQLPRATVTSALQRLEARLGTRLLHRTTRQVTPTLDGDAYYARCVRLLNELEEADSAFRTTAPKGLLRVSLQGTLARYFVLPRLPAFLERYPGIALHIDEGDRLVDLVREGVDCVLRAGELRDSSMVARRVALLEQLTCVSPDYVARHGEPLSPDALDGHVGVNYVSTATGRAYPFEFVVNGEVKRVTLPGPVTVSGAETYTAAALAGLGLIQVPRYRVVHHLAAHRLQTVLAATPPPPLPVSVMYPHNRQLSPRVRVFADWLQAVFAEP